MPPLTGRIPSAFNPSDTACALVITFFVYCWNSGVAHSLSATAFAATPFINGPPCIIGNTALSIA